MALLDAVKKSLRISSDDFDDEVQDLIDAAKADLILSGVSSEKVNTDTDVLIKRAVTCYCKANFGYDNPDSSKFEISYNSLKSHLSLSSDYAEVVAVEA